MQLLDPKNDVVFKLLFAHPNHRDILISLLTAVLAPPVPIVEAVVLNPEVRRDLPYDKGSVLDIHVQLADGRQVDVEMQAAVHPGLAERVLYYWARLYGSQLASGEDYGSLRPCIGIVFLNARLLPTARFHATFSVLEVHDYFALTDALELHIIELPKVGVDADGSRLAHWVRFFCASSDEEIQELAMNDRDIERAEQALRELSRDPVARELARERELARINWALIRGYEREEGREEGRQEGREEGHKQGLDEGQAAGLRTAIESVCDVLGIEITPQRQRRLQALSCAELADILGRIRTGKSWPGFD